MLNEAKAVFFYVNFKSVYVMQVFHRLDSNEYFKYSSLKNISKFFVSLFIKTTLTAKNEHRPNQTDIT